jgi:hypothetical protein
VETYGSIMGVRTLRQILYRCTMPEVIKQFYFDLLPKPGVVAEIVKTKQGGWMIRRPVFMWSVYSGEEAYLDKYYIGKE